jgi:cysteine desulfurase family protein (TIGR01976 family)
MPMPTCTAAGAATVDAIRANFPALERRHAGHPVAYFDGPGGTQVPRCVVDAVADYLRHHNANTHWAYPSSEETDAILRWARARFAAFLNAWPEEITFGANMTTLTFHLARALGRGWQPGDEVIVTELDHHANIDPWKAMARDRGLTVRTVRMDVAAGVVDWDDLRAALTPRTKLLAIGAASNALGTVTDVAAAARLAHEAGALVFVDAVHYAPHVLVDVDALGCDFLACSAYKFYGPHVGILYGRRALVESLDVPKLEPAPDHTGERLETGTQNHEGIAGAAAAVEFLASLATDAASPRQGLATAYAALHARGAAQVATLWEGLGRIPGLTLYGPAPDCPRTSTVSFAVRGHSSDAIARALAIRGVFVSNGDFYASTVVRRLELPADGLVRIGCAAYTTDTEVGRVIDGVSDIVTGRQRG